MITRFIHTSDWHIGRRLKNHDRYNEFEKFSDWLINLIEAENIEALLVSGDVFDNTTPSVKSQDIYYSFLSKLAESKCRHAVIISGNHDSPAFIDAPSKLLKLFKIHVIGTACENPEDEVVILRDENGNPEMIVCSVPYLRDRDVRTFEDAENINSALISGIINHYEKVFNYAEKICPDKNIPVISMGHLFAKGGKIGIDDGVRALYVGTAVEINSNIFPDFLTYTALGHLHSPQIVKRENIRYSGSPLVMGFGEAGQNKAVVKIELENAKIKNITEIPVPVFQKIERIQGNQNEIFSSLGELALQNKSIWIDITYNGNEAIGNLQEKLDEFMKKFPLIEVLSLRDGTVKNNIGKFNSDISEKGLEEIKPLEMLELCFDENNIPKEQREILIPLYNEILTRVEDENY